MHCVRIERGNIFEDPILLTETEVIRNSADILLSGSGPLADPVDSLGARIRKRADENRIRYAKHRRIGSDASGQRQCGGKS